MAASVHYVPPADFTDAFPSNVWGIALDQVSSNRRYVYLGVSRVGVVVLEFLPDAQGGPQVQFIEIIQTPGEAMGLWIRTDPDSGDHQLMVANTYAGIRVFGPGN